MDPADAHRIAHTTQMLWEKYDGITAKPFDIEYPAQPLMGWTAQLYRYFKTTEQ